MKRLLIILVFSIIIGIVFLELLNDQELKSNVAKILHVSNRVIDDKQNAYLAIYGVGYESSFSLHDTGRLIFEGKKSFISTIDRDNIFDVGGDNFGFCYNPEKPNCREYCCWSNNHITQVWNNNQALIAQTESLFAYKDYVELDRSIDTRLLIGLGNAAAIKIFFYINKGKIDEAIYAAINSVRFWRMILDKPVDIIRRLVLILNLSRSLSALAEILKKFDLNSDQLKKIEEVLYPHKSDKFIPLVIEGEIQSVYKSSNNFKRSEFKINATLNKLYEVMLEVSENIQCGQVHHVDEHSMLFEIYNPIGTMFINSSSLKNGFESEQYFNAKLQILRTILEISTGILRIEDLADYDKQVYIANQYTQLPVKFDTERKEYFISLGDGDRCRAFL